MKDFVGNAAVIKYLEDSVLSGGTSHAYLFCGPGNVGKTRAGLYFAKLLLCQSENPLMCRGCQSCTLIETGNHPDLYHIDSSTVLVNDMRSLVGSLELKPYMGKAKIAIVSHAENLTNGALNSFLKTLEEPTAKTIIILTTENPKNLLPTIVSRTRAIHFGFATDKLIYELLNGELGVLKDEAALLCRLSVGRPGLATIMAGEKEIAQNIVSMTKDFNHVYRSTDIYEKISFADILSKDKETLPAKLASLTLFARSELLDLHLSEKNKKEISLQIGLLDSLARSRDMIAGNANAKLVMESLLLGSII